MRSAQLRNRQRVTEKRVQETRSASRMTVLGRGRVAAPPSTSFGPESSVGESTELGSWSEELESAASKRSLEHWALVERTLFAESEQLPPGPLFDECAQWREQMVHLRLVGLGAAGPSHDQPTSNASSAARAASAKLNGDDPRAAEFARYETNLFTKESSLHSLNQKNLKQAKEEVLDHIVDFICKELAEIEAEKEAEELSDDFNEFLKIAPAPTCTGKNPLSSNNFYYNVEKTEPRNKDHKDKVEDEDKEMNSQGRRNKLGTVFNERIIVSPVPFIVTTRESFTTLRKTPIHYVDDEYCTHDDIHSGSRRENTRRKLSVTRKTPLIAAPRVQPSWNAPVCPTIWPKNIKLVPIDASRLPSSKRRSSKTADSVPPRRSRNSLSPISRSVDPPVSPRSNFHSAGLLDALEVRGSHIATPRVNGKPPRTRFVRPKRLDS